MAGKASTGGRSTGRKQTAGAPPRRRGGFGRETVAARRERTAEIIRRLHTEYPDARCSLDHRNAYELLAATILSAQCTDERVNMVTPALFKAYPAPADLAAAPQESVEELIRSTGFFRSKAKSLVGMATAVEEQHGGEVPRDMEALTALPGVGRKTANVVLGNAFGIDEGVVVDTHVKRLSGRLGLTRHTDPVKVEPDLMKLAPREEWTDLSHLFIYHGRAVCKAPTPRCEACVLADICPSSRV
ncbi:MAG TPA: endonuclease III [Longimicrobiales bacterium]|nr:endonuclease III [Longimicrobiales bacterium]